MYNSRRFQRSTFWLMHHLLAFINIPPKYSELDFWFGSDDPFDPDETVRFRYFKLLWMHFWGAVFAILPMWGFVIYVAIDRVTVSQMHSFTFFMFGIAIVMSPIIAFASLREASK
jgi:hypothetical protein